MIPGPRPSLGHDRPEGDRSGGPLGAVDGDPASDRPAVVLTRTPRGWAVVSPQGDAPAADLVEGLSLADLVAEEFGALLEPDRTTRRSARGPAEAAEAADPVDARIAALERTVAQLEHALAARVSTERAIGVLAERHAISPRAAFETLRREARSSGRTVAELAREVLDSLSGEAAPSDSTPDAGAAPLTLLPAAVAADGRS
ncbi:MAG: ANTAR domain-containing protein [Blastococcus sp.]